MDLTRKLEELFDFVRDGEESLACAVVKEIAREDAFFLYEEQDEEPVLALATRLGRLKVLKALIDAGVDKDSCGASLKPALMIAMSYDQREAFELLIREGASLSATDEFGTSLVQFAAGEVKDPYYLARLLESNAPVNTKDVEGNTPLHAVVKTDRIDCTEKLLKSGAVEIENNDGVSARSVAVERGSLEQWLVINQHAS